MPRSYKKNRRHQDSRSYTLKRSRSCKSKKRMRGGADECPICLGDVEEDLITACTNTQSYLHPIGRKCLYELITKYNTRQCPTCRSPILDQRIKEAQEFRRTGRVLPPVQPQAQVTVQPQSRLLAQREQIMQQERENQQWLEQNQQWLEQNQQWLEQMRLESEQWHEQNQQWHEQMRREREQSEQLIEQLQRQREQQADLERLQRRLEALTFQPEPSRYQEVEEREPMQLELEQRLQRQQQTACIIL